MYDKDSTGLGGIKPDMRALSHCAEVLKLFSFEMLGLGDEF